MMSTIDVKSRTKHPDDIPVGSAPSGVALTPDGKTAFVANVDSGTLSTINVKSRTKHPDDIPVGGRQGWPAITPDGKTAFVTDSTRGTVSTIDVKTRTKHPDDIPFGPGALGIAVTPDGKTAFVTNGNATPEFVGPGTLSTIDVKTRTKDPNDIPVGLNPIPGRGHIRRQDRRRRQQHRRHGLNDRREVPDQAPRRHSGRRVPMGGGDHAVSPVTDSPMYCDGAHRRRCHSATERRTLAWWTARHRRAGFRRFLVRKMSANTSWSA
jgi:YVTN family beta-propeller protein